MVDAGGATRPGWRPLVDAFVRGDDGGARIAADAARFLDEAGLSYNAFADGETRAGGWRFDPVPILLSGDDWAQLSRGALQRARMIEALLADAYGAQGLVAEGSLPPSFVFGAPQFQRACASWDRPPPRRLFRYALDVARGADGRWVVLEDSVDRPDGDGWALANRVAMAQAASDLFVEAGTRRLATHFAQLQTALEAAAGPEGRMAYLTAGPEDPTYFSHAYLARYLGLTLVEPGDLAVRDGEAMVKTLEGLRRLDLILRGAGSAGMDPLYAPGLGAIAPPGILRAARLGRLTFANAIGTGLLDGRALAPLSAKLIPRLLGEDPVLAEAPYRWLGDAAACDEVLAEPERWLVTDLRATASPGRPLVDRLAGLDATRARRLLAREGWSMVARGKIATATTPALGEAGLSPVPYAIRLFVSAAPHGFQVMAGGLGLGARGDGPLVGLPWEGTSRDVWVVDSGHAGDQPRATALLGERRRTAHLRRTGRDLLSRVADNLFWLGRYGERAELSLRVLKVVIERMIDAPRADREPVLLHALLSLQIDAVEGLEPTMATLRGRIAALALDPDSPNAVRPVLDALYRNAESTRAHLSRDAWRDIGALHAAPVWRLPPEPHRALSLAGPVETAIRSLAAFAGASHENMTRNFAWRFLELGRRLQRAIGVTAMFRAFVCAPTENEPATLYALLQLCDSFFAYRSRYLIAPEATPAIDLLVLDESNPRSLVFQVAAMETVLDALPRPSPLRNAEHRLVLRLLTDLRVADPVVLGEIDAEGHRPALDALLMDAEETLERVADLVTKAYFAHAELALTEVATARLKGHS
jgi:uncharacterized circularly permuted ATP-grasp superfamily protein/uncharacterized alpha-E superfamily protein